MIETIPEAKQSESEARGHILRLLGTSGLKESIIDTNSLDLRLDLDAIVSAALSASGASKAVSRSVNKCVSAWRRASGEVAEVQVKHLGDRWLAARFIAPARSNRSSARPKGLEIAVPTNPGADAPVETTISFGQLEDGATLAGGSEFFYVSTEPLSASRLPNAYAALIATGNMALQHITTPA